MTSKTKVDLGYHLMMRPLSELTLDNVSLALTLEGYTYVQHDVVMQHMESSQPVAPLPHGKFWTTRQPMKRGRGLTRLMIYPMVRTDQVDPTWISARATINQERCLTDWHWKESILGDIQDPLDPTVLTLQDLTEQAQAWLEELKPVITDYLCDYDDD